MSDQQFVLTLISIVAGTGLAIFIFGNFFRLVRLRIERKHEKRSDSGLQEEFEKFRQRAEKRLQVLESIVVEREETEDKPLLETQEKEVRHSLEDQPRLKNMLRS